eukprot:SAG31_NODE_1799_length_7241_cov_11.407029_4_plen_189_part_00
MPAELFGMVYLSDVPPFSGGTTVWPTSPQLLWECLESEHNCGFNPNEKYSPMFEDIVTNVQPVEFVGGAGDVIFRVSFATCACEANSHINVLSAYTRRSAHVAVFYLQLCPVHPAMIHSAGINTAIHGGEPTLRIAAVMEWQRARPSRMKRTMWWTLLLPADDPRAPSRGRRDRIECPCIFCPALLEY